jgi:hypothetical protein
MSIVNVKIFKNPRVPIHDRAMRRGILLGGRIKQSGKVASKMACLAPGIHGATAGEPFADLGPPKNSIARWMRLSIVTFIGGRLGGPRLFANVSAR